MCRFNAGLLLLALVVSDPVTVAQTEDSEPVEWLKAHAVPVRTIDPHDDDFSDLQPLKEMIGTARVVALGEQSHGDGATFLAKDRLIRFLHREMGFDVLAWESGLFDCRRIDAALRAGEDESEAARLGIFPIFTQSGQISPVFAYVRQTQSETRPLEMAGFDCQFSGADAGSAFAEYVRDFVENATPSAWTEQETDAGVAAVDWIVEQLGQAEPAQQDDELTKRRADVGRLMEMLDQRTERLKRCHSAREIAFAQRTLENLLVFDEVRRQPRGGSDPALTNLRDQRMGENLAWLAKEYYPDRKIIVWAASFHLMRNAPTVKVISGKFRYDNVTPMGHAAFDLLGEDYYSVMFTAYEGEAGNPFYGARKLDKAAAGTLEDSFQAAGFDYAFVDLRGVRQANAPAWLLDGKLVARPLGYSPMRSNWTNVFDAVLFTRKMFPSTRDGAVPDGVRTAKPESSKQPPEQAELAAALKSFRDTLVTYSLNMDAVFPNKPPQAPDQEALRAYPTPQAWPRVLGHVVPDPKSYKLVDGAAERVPKAKGGLAVREPAEWQLVRDGYTSLVFLEGVAESGGFTAKSYASVVCIGPMAGSLFLSTYASLLIDGNLSGSLTSTSYFVGVITGDVNGLLQLDSYAMVYVRGCLGTEGKIRLKNSKVAISGRTTNADLERISGVGHVYLEDSDLPEGKHKLGELVVIVGKLGK